MAKTFRDLRVWQSGMDLVELVYNLTRLFPKPEDDGLALQIREAVTCIPANVAAGTMKADREGYIHSVSMAQASLAMLQTHIELTGRLHYLSTEQVGQTLERVETLGRWLTALHGALKKSSDSPPGASAA
jgi:four helix bundle protein